MDIVEEMMKPKTYGEGVSSVRKEETHTSWVFLTGKHAYKVKKPVDFGFLDFTTLEKRKYFCEQEIILNRRLCGPMYKAAIPIVQVGDGLKVDGSGQVIEYAVKMTEFPQNALMSNMLKERTVDKSQIEDIAHIVADFHSKAETGGEINEGGSLATIRFNWDENFDQTKKYIGITINQREHDFIRRKVGEFLSVNVPLFESRVRDGRIRDCHGDIRPNNIFIHGRKIYIFDCIEFNTRFRYSDVVADIAFMCPDLDYYHKTDLSEHFAGEYISRSLDSKIPHLLPFYNSYRAFVIGKVTSFRLGPNVSSWDRDLFTDKAGRYFDLAFDYAAQL